MRRHQSEVVGRQRTAEGPQAKLVGLVAHLVRDEGVAGSNPATPTSFLVAPIRLRGQLCGTKHTSDNLAPPIPIHSAPSGGGAGVSIWKRCQMSIANCSEVAGVGCRLAAEARNIRLFFYCCGPQPTPAPSPDKQRRRRGRESCGAGRRRCGRRERRRSRRSRDEGAVPRPARR